MKRAWVWSWAMAGLLAVAGPGGVGAAGADTITPPMRAGADSTFCNPLNLEYCFTPYNWKARAREAADPMVVPFKGSYYLFPSKSGGYWQSDDLLQWNLVESHDAYRYVGDGEHVPNGPETELPVWGYGPTAAVVNGDLVYSQQVDTFWRLTDPKKGTIEKIRDRLPVSNDGWLFADDDGRVYFYAVRVSPRGIYAYELDPKDRLNVLRGPEPCMIYGDVRAGSAYHTYQLETADGAATAVRPLSLGEGPQMTKRNGRYFLQVSHSGTEDPNYRDIAFVSESPMGPFRYAKNNPVSYRPAGFTHGAGNTGVFADRHGQDWRVVTTCIGVFHNFERRVSMYPAGVDKDHEMYTDTYLGDLPQYGPGHRRKGLGGNLVGWMLLSQNAPATASSTLDGRPPAAACDENIQTWWSAKTGDKGEWLALDLGKPCRINSVQVNFAEQDATAVKRRPEDELYHQYTLEVSADGQTWKTLVDKSSNPRDVPHDYVQLEKPVVARYVKLTNLHMAAHGKFAVRDLRVFGSGLGKPPAAVDSATAQRKLGDVRAEVEWPAAKGASGYVVRWGIAQDKLYLSQDVRSGTRATLECLTGGVGYWFAVDSFNDSGITFGTAVLPLGEAPASTAPVPAPTAPAPASTILPGVENLPRPTAEQAQWQDHEIGIFFHYDMNAFKPGWDHRKYDDFPKPEIFNPTNLDMKQWMEVPKALDAKYAVITATHGSGFMLWQSEAYPYGMKQSPWKNGKGDLVQEFVTNCRKIGVAPGIYCHMRVNGWWQVDHPGFVNRGRGGDDARQAQYAAAKIKQVEELWGHYGPLAEIWIDGGLPDPKAGYDVLPYLKKLQPKAMVNGGGNCPVETIRWLGGETGKSSYPCWATGDGVFDGKPGTPDGKTWCPGEADVDLLVPCLSIDII